MPYFALSNVLYHQPGSDSSLQPFALSYPAVNLWIYVVIIPLVWTLLLDRKLRTRYLMTLAYCILVSIAGILEYNNRINLFQAGVNFCVYMQTVHHCTYAESCIIWCVLMPLTITIILISLPQRQSPNHSITVS